MSIIRKMQMAAATDTFQIPTLTGISLSGSFDISGIDSTPGGVAIGDRGATLAFTGLIGNNVYEVLLSTPWDITTGAHNSGAVLSGIGTNPHGAVFSDDGTKFYTVITFGSDTIKEYPLSTPWDITTAGTSVTLDISTQSGNAGDMEITDDGKLIIVPDRVASVLLNTYVMSTAWDLSTASYDASYTLGSSELTDCRGVAVDRTGRRMFLMDTTGGDLYQYTLSTPFDLSTGSYDSVSHTMSGGGDRYHGLSINALNQKLYTGDLDSDVIEEYDIGLEDP